MPSNPKRRGRRPNFPLAFKLALVEQSMQPGVSTARLAREHGINDNLLFNWRNLYKQGRLGTPLPAEPCLLPVELEDMPSPPPITEADKTPPSDAAECELVLPGGTLRLRGALSPALLSMLIHELKGARR
ncbi:MAG: transposase [Serratia marcescens]|nr:transposase [Serratia marcescens]